MTTEKVPAELDKISEILRLYSKALSGREIRIIPRGGSSPRGAGWVTPTFESEAVTVSLPQKIDHFPTEKENFDWYKVILTHQAGHVEFGTFSFEFDKPSRQFRDWRPKLSRNLSAGRTQSNFQRLIELFPDASLGMLIFNSIEDARIDAQVHHAYRGIRRLYRKVSKQVLKKRPRLALLPLREALLEGLVQGSLGGNPLQTSPYNLKESLQAVLNILSHITTPNSEVEDSAEAALRIYQIAAELPNTVTEECNHDHDHRIHNTKPEDKSPDKLKEPPQEPEELPFEPPQEVEFRLDMDQKLFDQLSPPPEPEEGAKDLSGQTDDPEGPLTRDEPFCYLYPEWNFRIRAFHDRWCRVRERTMEEGTSEFYENTLVEYQLLVNQVRRRFEQFLPELFRKVTRRQDGEDVDLDRLVEAVVDRQAGSTPSEKIYWRRERTQRDVAVAVLLDMSATTNEYIGLKAAEASRPTQATAQEYSNYLQQVAAGVNEFGKPLRKRTIDIEKEAAILLMQALQSIGDSFAMYTFSGSGRGEVFFHVIKDFEERLGPKIARRFDHIAPAQATRMGAAIRHTIRKLERVQAQTRLLFLISDGRPYDRDYGRDADDLQYPVWDTRQALQEAVQRKIRPFCLTVDKEGSDYLRAMCEDIPYEVVEDVEDLPISLIAVYPKLTSMTASP